MRNETEFKTLTAAGMYIDPGRLMSGLYHASTPTLFNREDTLESYIERILRIAPSAGLTDADVEAMMKNLSHCELTPIEVVFT